MLIADRFLALDGVIVDLAFGGRVDFRELPPVSRAETAEWNERCARDRPADGRSAPAGLLDYGLLPNERRFEAYRLSAARPGRRAPALSIAALSPDAALQQVLDVFEMGCLGELRCMRPWPAGSQPSQATLDVIARQARLRGFVPISLEQAVAARARNDPAHLAIREVLATRHVLVVATNPVSCARCGRSVHGSRDVSSTCPADVARFVVSLGCTNPRPNVLLLAGNGIEPVIDGALTPRCCGWQPIRRTGRRDVALARRPGHARPNVAGMAAEPHETYQVAAPEVARLRALAAEAVGHARRGRFRQAEYGLREMAGALARREDASGAGWVALNLGCVLLGRGRAVDAARAFDSARVHFDHGGDTMGSTRATIFLGLAWIDDARLAEAEAALRSARIAAYETATKDLGGDAELALARCLYWQGRFDEATVLVSASLDRTVLADAAPAATQSGEFPAAETEKVAMVREGGEIESWRREAPDGRVLPFHRALEPSDRDRVVIAAALATRLSLVCGDVRRAAGHARRAVERAQAAGSPREACTAHAALAAVHAALRDSAALEEDVRKGLMAARLAHAPLCALRLRLLACDGLRQAGATADAKRLASRLARLDPSRLPALLAARLKVIVEGEAQSTTARADVAPGLATATRPWRAADAPSGVSDDIVRVLQVCHDIEDERAALNRVCEVLRDRTHAVATALVGRGCGAAATLARAGSSQDALTVASRVLDTGLPVSDMRTLHGVEAAFPVRYAGAIVGALTCRWTADVLLDAARASCLMSAAAAAVAPHVRSLLDRLDAPRVTLSADGAATNGEGDLVGASDAIEALRRLIERAALAPFPVLIVGESGSGKELVAHAIHRGSARRMRRFCALNCAALTEELLESELFGHLRGAFTGAIADRAGLFEEADGGTLFLDEVADLSPRAQAKLLRTVQEGELRRVGENHARRVDVRIVAATNRSLDGEVRAGSFRRDLLYRLDVVHIDVPPLRERPEDVPVLAAHFWRRAAARTGSRATLSPATLASLSRYDWPGNVRELQNVMFALAVSAPRRGSIGPACLPAVIASQCELRITLDDARRTFERRFVRAALARACGHRGRAAASLGVTRQGLAKLMARLDLETGVSEASEERRSGG